ncbi:Uncharacterised protein [Serratia odorifera]|uniref:Uncharacterized protein n=1 Tax=Serratia odorifera TaxID=618 RepID=A0A3S4HSZ4_SEROD|nr:Uncharacterised protein [Serratia odorifera]
MQKKAPQEEGRIMTHRENRYVNNVWLLYGFKGKCTDAILHWRDELLPITERPHGRCVMRKAKSPRYSGSLWG